MKITLKFYGKLVEHLPKNSSKNQSVIEVPGSMSIEQLLDDYHVPQEQRHIVMVNGVHIMPEDRKKRLVSASDSLAVWPPSTG